jgi:hypothetical protein
VIELIVALVFVIFYGTIFGSHTLAHNTPFWLPIEFLVGLTWNEENMEPRWWLVFTLGTFLVWLLILGVEMIL